MVPSPRRKRRTRGGAVAKSMIKKKPPPAATTTVVIQNLIETEEGDGEGENVAAVCSEDDIDVDKLGGHRETMMKCVDCGETFDDSNLFKMHKELCKSYSNTNNSKSIARNQDIPTPITQKPNPDPKTVPIQLKLNKQQQQQQQHVVSGGLNLTENHSTGVIATTTTGDPHNEDMVGGLALVGVSLDQLTPTQQQNIVMVSAGSNFLPGQVLTTACTDSISTSIAGLVTHAGGLTQSGDPGEYLTVPVTASGQGTGQSVLLVSGDQDGIEGESITVEAQIQVPTEGGGSEEKFVLLKIVPPPVTVTTQATDKLKHMVVQTAGLTATTQDPKKVPIKHKKRRLIIDNVTKLNSSIMQMNIRETHDIMGKIDLAPPSRKLMKWRECGGVDTLLQSSGRKLECPQLESVLKKNLLAQIPPDEAFVNKWKDLDTIADDKVATVDLGLISDLNQQQQQHNAAVGMNTTTTTVTELSNAPIFVTTKSSSDIQGAQLLVSTDGSANGNATAQFVILDSQDGDINSGDACLIITTAPESLDSTAQVVVVTQAQ